MRLPRGSSRFIRSRPIEEGIELLTGTVAGHVQAGKYPVGSVYGKVERRLAKMAREPARGDASGRKASRKTRKKKGKVADSKDDDNESTAGES